MKIKRDVDAYEDFNSQMEVTDREAGQNDLPPRLETSLCDEAMSFSFFFFFGSDIPNRSTLHEALLRTTLPRALRSAYLLHNTYPNDSSPPTLTGSTSCQTQHP